MVPRRTYASLVALAVAIGGCGGGEEQTSQAPETTPEASEQAAEPTEQAQWEYEGERGPDNWAGLSADYATCEAGREQSPISVDRGDRRDLCQPGGRKRCGLQPDGRWAGCRRVILARARVTRFACRPPTRGRRAAARDARSRRATRGSSRRAPRRRGSSRGQQPGRVEGLELLRLALLRKLRPGLGKRS